MEHPNRETLARRVTTNSEDRVRQVEETDSTLEKRILKNENIIHKLKVKALKTYESVSWNKIISVIRQLNN